MGVHQKIQFLGGIDKKPIYRGELPKRGVRSVCRFKRELGEKEVVFLRRRGVDTPMNTMLFKHLMYKIHKTFSFEATLCKL